MAFVVCISNSRINGNSEMIALIKYSQLEDVFVEVLTSNQLALEFRSLQIRLRQRVTCTAAGTYQVRIWQIISEPQVEHTQPKTNEYQKRCSVRKHFP